MSTTTPILPKVRSSNLELYRIICMLMIVSHHFVVHSGLTSELLLNNPTALNSIFLWFFGMWGKTGINCFLMITGYFMCKSQITVRKFLKLMLEIYFYRIAIFFILLIGGYETISFPQVVKLLMPVWDFNTNFTSCFIGFWLTIPFINILVQNMTKRQHLLLLALLLGMNTIFGSLPSFHIGMNYVTWFGVIYLTASYLRLYPTALTENRRFWGGCTIAIFIISVLSVIAMLYIGKSPYYFVSDSNKILAVAFAISSFLWAKNIEIPHSKLINAIGGSTFGVLLIHDASGSMRKWLWVDTVNCVGHYYLPIGRLIFFCLGTVLTIFIICIIIDRLRIKLLENPLFRWYDKKFLPK